ncbi:unnamed protein product [Vitrella brassicaformis CCMP3155]|uniref:Uncharacterized protein n=1 Tax=Vitrella brassicaformis (strain CCMP3155) TaxID=1169540 RepID=A0A0G4GYV5_VITBC|nr:unnamed protein product [Vitrella brassicaformis CCMP3155]|eukprot:CEM36347.1 unnamed protein product [Vitrella brassicaformis CCMP3155]
MLVLDIEPQDAVRPIYIDWYCVWMPLITDSDVEVFAVSATRTMPYLSAPQLLRRALVADVPLYDCLSNSLIEASAPLATVATHVASFTERRDTYRLNGTKEGIYAIAVEAFQELSRGSVIGGAVTITDGSQLSFRKIDRSIELPVSSHATVRLNRDSNITLTPLVSYKRQQAVQVFTEQISFPNGTIPAGQLQPGWVYHVQTNDWTTNIRATLSPVAGEVRAFMRDGEVQIEQHGWEIDPCARSIGRETYSVFVTDPKRTKPIKLLSYRRREPSLRVFLEDGEYLILAMVIDALNSTCYLSCATHDDVPAILGRCAATEAQPICPNTTVIVSLDLSANNTMRENKTEEESGQELEKDLDELLDSANPHSSPEDQIVVVQALEDLADKAANSDFEQDELMDFLGKLTTVVLPTDHTSAKLQLKISARVVKAVVENVFNNATDARNGNGTDATNALSLMNTVYEDISTLARDYSLEYEHADGNFSIKCMVLKDDNKTNGIKRRRVFLSPQSLTYATQAIIMELPTNPYSAKHTPADALILDTAITVDLWRDKTKLHDLGNASVVLTFPCGNATAQVRRGQPFCMQWDEQAEQYIDAHCDASANNESIQCTCNHLSTFAAALYPAHEQKAGNPLLIFDPEVLLTMLKAGDIGLLFVALSCAFLIVPVMALSLRDRKDWLPIEDRLPYFFRDTLERREGFASGLCVLMPEIRFLGCFTISPVYLTTSRLVLLPLLPLFLLYNALCPTRAARKKHSDAGDHPSAIKHALVVIRESRRRGGHEKADAFTQAFLNEIEQQRHSKTAKRLSRATVGTKRHQRLSNKQRREEQRLEQLDVLLMQSHIEHTQKADNKKRKTQRQPRRHLRRETRKEEIEDTPFQQQSEISVPPPTAVSVFVLREQTQEPFHTWTSEYEVFCHPASHFTDRKWRHLIDTNGPLKAIELDDIHTIEQDQHAVSLYDRDHTLLLSLQPTNTDRDLLMSQAIKEQTSKTCTPETAQQQPSKQDSLLVPLRSPSDEQPKPPASSAARPSIHEMTEAHSTVVTLVPSGVAAVAQVIRAAKEARKILLESYGGEVERTPASAFAFDGPVMYSACFCMVNGQCAHIWWGHDGLVSASGRFRKEETMFFFSGAECGLGRFTSDPRLLLEDMSEPILEETAVSLGNMRLMFTDPLPAESFTRIITQVKASTLRLSTAGSQETGQDEELQRQRQRRETITSFYTGTESHRPPVASTYRRPSVVDVGKTGSPLARADADRLRYQRWTNCKILARVVKRDHPLLSSLTYNPFSARAQRFAALEASLMGMITISSLFFWSSCATVHIVGHQIDPYVDSSALYLSRVCYPPSVTHLPSAATVTVSAVSFVIASAVGFVIYALFRRFLIGEEMSAAEREMQIHFWRMMDFIGWTLWRLWNVACVGWNILFISWMWASLLGSAYRLLLFPTLNILSISFVLIASKYTPLFDGVLIHMPSVANFPYIPPQQQDRQQDKTVRGGSLIVSDKIRSAKKKDSYAGEDIGRSSSELSSEDDNATNRRGRRASHISELQRLSVGSSVGEI